MWIGVFVKLGYAAALWWWVLPRSMVHVDLTGLIFRHFPVFIRMGILFGLCATAEIVISAQFQVFTVNHMIHHGSPAIWRNVIAYLLISLVVTSIYFTIESFRSERLKREYSETQLTAELNFLQSQINPHFLFNTLNNLFSLAQKAKNEELATAISRLSGLMRYMLYDKGQQVPLQKEVDHLRDFIGLASMRFSTGEVMTSFEIAGDTDNILIAPMLLLPFVENAFKHGVRIEEKSAVDIRLRIEDGGIQFKCSNTKKLNPSDVGSTGIGLENVRRRLELLYSARHRLTITETDQVFSVELRLWQ